MGLRRCIGDVKDSGFLAKNVDEFGRIDDERSYGGTGFWGTGIGTVAKFYQYLQK